MPVKKKTTNKKHKGFEETLWDTINKQRGSVESSEYKHVVLSLIFLKFVSVKLEDHPPRFQTITSSNFSIINFEELGSVFPSHSSKSSRITQRSKDALAAAGYAPTGTYF